MRKICTYLIAGSLLLAPGEMAFGQRGRDSYYRGMDREVRSGDYERYSRDDDRRHHHDEGGGVGPGKGALIGGAGGAVLGALFGGGLKGSLIGGAAGAGIGALGAQLAQGNDDHRDDRRRRR